MIQPNELRIGNWVYKQSNKLITDKTELFQIRVVTPQETHKYEPIPLTSEILSRCGFEKTDNSNEYWSFYRLKNGWYISLSHHNEPSAGVENGFCYWGDEYLQIKFLHQLQNIYYSLTQTELPVQL